MFLDKLVYWWACHHHSILPQSEFYSWSESYGRTLAEHAKNFNFPGLALIVSGVVWLHIGVNFGKISRT